MAVLDDYLEPSKQHIACLDKILESAPEWNKAPLQNLGKLRNTIYTALPTDLHWHVLYFIDNLIPIDREVIAAINELKKQELLCPNDTQTLTRYYSAFESFLRHRKSGTPTIERVNAIAKEAILIAESVAADKQPNSLVSIIYAYNLFIDSAQLPAEIKVGLKLPGVALPEAYQKLLPALRNAVNNLEYVAAVSANPLAPVPD